MPDDTPRPAGGPGAAGRAALRKARQRLVAPPLAEVEHRALVYADDVGRRALERADATDAALDRLAERVDEQDRRLVGASERLHALERVLNDLGSAMSREHGLAGAAEGYREAVYLLHELRRDLRRHELEHTDEPPDSPAPATAADGGPRTDPYAGKHPRRFDYSGFERRFRGDPDDVRRLLVERYGSLLARHSPVLDIGCGRGELLGALLEQGVEVMGVEPEPSLAAQARERGVPVEESLGADYLRGVEDGSLGAIVCFHVVEHLVVDDLIELLQLAARKLRPGGVFVAETPNPMTFLTLHESYLLDPTHVQPLHPSLLSWLAETAGFRSIEVAYHSPATSLHLPKPDDDGTPLAQQVRRALERLDHQLYGPQDYSVVARA